MKYLFPCEKCGETHPIDTSQAGQQISCQCGQLLEAPSLRGIRELEPAVEAAATGPRRDWSLGRGLASVGGFLLAGGGLAVVIFAGMYRTQLGMFERPVYDAEMAQAEIDALSPGQAFDTWAQIRENGLGPYRPPLHFMARQSRERSMVVMIVASVLALCGITSAAGAILFRRGRRG